MSLLDVEGLKKVYTTRFGGNAGRGAAQCEFLGGGGRVRRHHGRIRVSGKTTLLNILAALDRPDGRRACCSTARISPGCARAHGRPSAATTSASCFRSSTCWTPLRSRTTSTCRSSSRASAMREMQQRLSAAGTALWASTELLEKVPLRGLRRAEAARRRGARADHGARASCWPTSRPARSTAAPRTSCCASSSQINRRRADHPHGHALRARPRAARAASSSSRTARCSTRSTAARPRTSSSTRKSPTR